jgi:SAM-dependent methyltransferase
MRSLTRIRGALAEFRRAGSIRHLSLPTGICPLCGKTRFIVLKPDPYFVRCFKCKANATNLSIVKVIQQNVSALGNKLAYEMSTYGSTYNFLKVRCPQFISSEFFPGHRSGEVVDGIRNEDAQCLSFADESLDLITSNQVFEHVPDHAAAFKECWRTLRPEGCLIFTVPLNNNPQTEHLAVLEDGNIRWLSTPEFHASRSTGPKTIPVFWRYSTADILERVRHGGFRHASILEVTIIPQQVEPQKVIYAVK